MARLNAANIMKALLKKLKEEKEILEKKVEKLEFFINESVEYTEANETQRTLLHIQLDGMKLYLNILKERIWNLQPNTVKITEKVEDIAEENWLNDNTVDDNDKSAYIKGFKAGFNLKKI
jgi:hypothetical protein